MQGVVCWKWSFLGIFQLQDKKSQRTFGISPSPVTPGVPITLSDCDRGRKVGYRVYRVFSMTPSKLGPVLLLALSIHGRR